MINLQARPRYALHPSFWAWWRLIERLGSTRPLQGPQTAKLTGRPKFWIVSRYSKYGYQVVTRCATFPEAQIVLFSLQRSDHQGSISHALDGVETYSAEVLINRWIIQLRQVESLLVRLRQLTDRNARLRPVGGWETNLAFVEKTAQALEQRIDREIAAVTVRAFQRGYVAELTRICNVRLFQMTKLPQES